MTGMTTEAEEMKDADYPELRLFRVEHQLAPDGEKDDCQGRWLVCTPKNLYDFSAVGFVFGRRLHKELNVPVGMIQSTWGGTHAESWTKMSVMKNNPLYADVLEDFALKNVKQEKGYCKVPATLWNGMIHPILGYTVKGNIWYQGESNAHNWEAHEKLFKLLVNSWRKNWNDACLPFYYVQLSSLNRPSWPWFRESQRRMLNEISHIGMAVSSDHGDSLDVHPICKKPVGERLARGALNKTYQKNVIPSGPLFRGANVRGGKVFLSFDYGKGMRSSDGKPLQCFEVAEYDGIYYPATAEVVGDQVKVYSKEVPNPRYVRYGWQPFTRANLINREGLPASTFRAEFSMK